MYITNPQVRSASDLRAKLSDGAHLSVHAPARATLRRLDDPVTGACNVQATDGALITVRIRDGYITEALG